MPGSPQLARIQWPNQNTLRRYPLAVHASGVDVSGRFNLPTSTFVDASVSTTFQSKLHFAQFYISQLTVSADSFRVVISHAEETLPVGYAAGRLNSQPENQTHTIYGVNSLSGTLGYLVTGDLKQLAALPPGSYNFTVDNGALDPGVVHCAVKSMRSIAVEVSGTTATELNGKVIIRAASGTQFRLIEEEEQNIVIWDAIGNPDLVADCECEASDLRPILTVGGLPPDETGAVNIFGSRCLEVEPQAAGVQLSNSCSEPCCDCQDDSGLEDRLDLLYQQILTMDSRLASLETRYSQVDKLIGSSESGCDSIECPPYEPLEDLPLINDFKLDEQ